MVDRTIQVSRQELYEMIWSRPTTLIAKDFRMSDVGVSKICKKLDIPKPPPGYWQRIKVGQKPQRPALAKASRKTPNHVLIEVRTEPRTFKITDPEVLARIQSESDLANQISVGPSLRNSHPLVRITREALEHSTADEYRRLRNGSEYLDIRVSRKVRRRALLLMNALLKALEARGCSVEIHTQSWPGTKIVVGETKIGIYLTEKVVRSENPEAKEEHGWVSNRFLYTSTGKLSFIIDEYMFDGVRKTWRDREERQLENQLNDLVVGIWTAAEAQRIRQAERDRETTRVGGSTLTCRGGTFTRRRGISTMRAGEGR